MSRKPNSGSFRKGDPRTIEASRKAAKARRSGTYGVTRTAKNRARRAGFGGDTEAHAKALKALWDSGRLNLPQDHPARQLGLTLDAEKVIDLLFPLMGMTKEERKQWEATKRRFERLKNG